MAKARTRPETLQQRKDRARKILAKLVRAHGRPSTALKHKSALQLLIATILSAQSTDETINQVTPALFRTYPDAESFVHATTAELEDAIRQSGFFRAKAKAIQGATRMIVERFGGEVPSTMDELVTLPGVGRKTANVVLGTWFKKNEGVVVDTHVGRLAERMGLTWTARNAKDAIAIEKDLMQIVPRRSWTDFAHVMVRHGREICKARKPACDACPVVDVCPSAQKPK